VLPASIRVIRCRPNSKQLLVLPSARFQHRPSCPRLTVFDCHETFVCQATRRVFVSLHQVKTSVESPSYLQGSIVWTFVLSSRFLAWADVWSRRRLLLGESTALSVANDVRCPKPSSFSPVCCLPASRASASAATQSTTTYSWSTPSHQRYWSKTLENTLDVQPLSSQLLSNWSSFLSWCTGRQGRGALHSASLGPDALCVRTILSRKSPHQCQGQLITRTPREKGRGCSSLPLIVSLGTGLFFCYCVAQSISRLTQLHQVFC
jgi:hypothetical protein